VETHQPARNGVACTPETTCCPAALPARSLRSLGPGCSGCGAAAMCLLEAWLQGDSKRKPLGRSIADPDRPGPAPRRPRRRCGCAGRLVRGALRDPPCLQVIVSNRGPALAPRLPPGFGADGVGRARLAAALLGLSAIRRLLRLLSSLALLGPQAVARVQAALEGAGCRLSLCAPACAARPVGAQLVRVCKPSCPPRADLLARLPQPGGRLAGPGAASLGAFGATAPATPACGALPANPLSWWCRPQWWAIPPELEVLRARVTKPASLAGAAPGSDASALPVSRNRVRQALKGQPLKPDATGCCCLHHVCAMLPALAARWRKQRPVNPLALPGGLASGSRPCGQEVCALGASEAISAGHDGSAAATAAASPASELPWRALSGPLGPSAAPPCLPHALQRAGFPNAGPLAACKTLRPPVVLPVGAGQQSPH